MVPTQDLPPGPLLHRPLQESDWPPIKQATEPGSRLACCSHLTGTPRGARLTGQAPRPWGSGAQDGHIIKFASSRCCSHPRWGVRPDQTGPQGWPAAGGGSLSSPQTVGWIWRRQQEQQLRLERERGAALDILSWWDHQSRGPRGGQQPPGRANADQCSGSATKWQIPGSPWEASGLTRRWGPGPRARVSPLTTAGST